MRTLKFLLILGAFPTMLLAQNTNSVKDVQKIINEDINSVIYTDKEFKQPVADKPNWRRLQKNISKKYRELNSRQIVNRAKIPYYSSKKDWDSYADAYLINLEKYEHIDTTKNRLRLVWSINNTLYEKIFKYVNDQKLLERAAVQAKKIIDNPYAIRKGKPREIELSNSIDTYANLLYKSGKTNEAIEWQMKAVEYTGGKNKDFKANLEKMQGKVPTW